MLKPARWSKTIGFRLGESEFATIVKQSQTLDTMLLRQMKTVQPAKKSQSSD